MTVYVFFFNDTATTEIYTLSLHDALPISRRPGRRRRSPRPSSCATSWTTSRGYTWTSPAPPGTSTAPTSGRRSEEHTSELQSRQYLVCRLLLEKKNTSPDHSYTLYPLFTH